MFDNKYQNGRFFARRFLPADKKERRSALACYRFAAMRNRSIEGYPAANCSPASGGIPHKEFKSIDNSLANPETSCGECARCCGSKKHFLSF